jgi:hypothetical protein
LSCARHVSFGVPIIRSPVLAAARRDWKKTLVRDG